VSEVRVIRAEDRRPGDATAGMSREEVAAGEAYWSGYVTTDPGAASGWHHHGEYDSVAYVLTGAIRVESGPGGSDVVEAKAGDFLLIPKRTVHREGNPTDERADAVVVRIGTGQAVFNVDAPDPG
jgi:uncharacterized RmlC-like cupin family protein